MTRGTLPDDASEEEEEEEVPLELRWTNCSCEMAYMYSLEIGTGNMGKICAGERGS